LTPPNSVAKPAAQEAMAPTQKTMLFIIIV
jgi:hypothetical protein